jgi:tetratricopeptide (TPR) repeat protein
MPVREEALSRARAAYDAGDFDRSASLALEGLAGDPDDPELLRVAGASTLALDVADASVYFTKLVAVAPNDVAAWRDLGAALLAEGSDNEATAAFRRALELAPNDAGTLVDLGHAAGARGAADEAIGYLERAWERAGDNIDILRSKLDVERRSGRLEAALATARDVLDRRADDVKATLDVAELSLACGRLDDAVAAYRQLRRLDAEPGHAVYAFHGLVAVEIRRQEWRRALEVAIEAARIDRHRRTTDLIAFIAAQLFGPGTTPAPSPAEVDRIMSQASAEHRLLHVEPLGF